MPAQITGLLGRLQAAVRQFTLAQRTLALLGAAVLVLGAVALSAWLTKPTMSPLFSGLSATDASAIVEQLTAQGVAYELTDGGATVMVPAAQVYPMRLAAASAGLPAASDGAGYSLLDDMGMTSSEFQQQVTYQRALEGELAKTIGAINGVEAATVRLALPEESVFVSETADPTASVFVKTGPGVSLGSDKVQSIVHLVSAGIEGMSPADVAVIDADGHVLSAVGGTAGGGLQGSQTGEYETRIASNVQQMLDKVVGVGNAVVSVTADLDYDQTARTSETYTAGEDLPPLSSATTLEEYSGAENAVGGVLGPDGVQTPADEGQGSGAYRKESATVNNPLNKVTEQTTSTPGAVRRQSVSVVVSDGAGAGLDMNDLEAAVIAAAGIDPERGDRVSVSRMSFDTTTAESAQKALAAAEEQAKAEESSAMIRTGAIGAAVLLGLIIMIVTAQRRSRRARREAIDLGALELIESRQTEILEQPEPTLALPVAPPAQDPVAAKREDVMALAAEQPAEVAEMLRGWLVGGGRR
jgi:flagellar M-ring protein FliF